MKILRYAPFLLIIVACSNSKTKGQQSSITKMNTQRIDTMLLSQPGAVIVNPSSRQIDNMKKGQSDADYDTVVDDNVFYMSESEHYLDSLKIYKINRESEGIMRFKTIQGKVYTLKLDTLYFDIVLFNGKDKPRHANITDMRDELKRYMKE